MRVLDAIYDRRSVRNFRLDPVSREDLLEIMKAGSWAPSGLNNQPWRFVLVTGRDKRLELAALTRYRHVIEGAPALIAVFCDRSAMYHETKDHQAIGACLQNMLLAAHALGLGAVWLGEILKNEGSVRQLLQLSEQMALMAVVAVGYPSGEERSSRRKPLDSLLLNEF